VSFKFSFKNVQRIYKLLIYVYKEQHGKAPSYLQELITPYKPNRALRSENSMLHQLKLAIEFYQCYESAENTILWSHWLAVPYWWFYQSTFLDFSHKTQNMTISRQFLSRYTDCRFITVANTNFLYMCTKHSMARLLAIFKNW
jgi:hypothetical protein